MFAPRAHLAQLLHQPRFAALVLRVIDVAKLEEHVQLHELLLDGRVIGQLGLDDVLDLLQRPANAGDRSGDRKEEELGEEAHGGRSRGQESGIRGGTGPPRFARAALFK